MIYIYFWSLTSNELYRFIGNLDIVYVLRAMNTDTIFSEFDSNCERPTRRTVPILVLLTGNHM